jgi:hypothetical protein
MASICPYCACISADGMRAHAVLKLLVVDDLDAALVAGLQDSLTCLVCEPRCNALLAAAHETRLTALAARDRHRARDARLLRRKAEREAARVPKALPTQNPALPAAAADVLARALAKARTPR